MARPRLLDMQPTAATCPSCGRKISTYDSGDGKRRLLGHRVTMPHTPATPWCEGGGRHG